MNANFTTVRHDIALTVKNVSKEYGKVVALRDVSFELRRGEFLTMLGPSGSGKTTTLRVIAGFLRPDSGSVVIHGRDVVDVAPNKRDIGMVFQDYALFPHMTVGENIGFPLETRGMSKADRRKWVSDMLDVVGLSNFADRYPKQLSGGQQQRVALARALVFNPEVVLLDEPMAALDKKLRANMQLEILRIAKQVGATVISVTHDQEEALVMSDRIALFNQGELAQIAAPLELYQRPRTEFVADFIGEANVLQGTTSQRPGGLAVSGQGWNAFVENHQVPMGLDAGKIKLVVRPETIRLRAVDSPASENRAEGVLTDKIYLGVEFKLIVDLGAGQKVQVRSRQLRDVSDLEVGSRIQVTWNSDDIVVIRN